MEKKIVHDYEPELDILHVYSEGIKEGIKGCISLGDFNIDIGNDNKVMGVEVEEASKLLRLSPDILSSLDNTNLVVRKKGNMLFIGVEVIKGPINSSIHVTSPSNKIPIQASVK